MNHSRTNPNRVIRLQEVCDIVGLSRATLYRMMRESRFPRQIKLSQQAVGWRLEAVLLWLQEREIESTPSSYSIH